MTSPMTQEEREGLVKAGKRFSLHAGDRYRHLKRGTFYTLPFGRAEAMVQCQDPIQDGDVVLIYIGDNGMIFARPPHEFFDGRFAPVSTSAEPDLPTPNVAELIEALERGAKYLDDLGDNLLRNDADMRLDPCEDPKDVADELRAVLSLLDRIAELEGERNTFSKQVERLKADADLAWAEVEKVNGTWSEQQSMNRELFKRALAAEAQVDGLREALETNAPWKPIMLDALEALITTCEWLGQREAGVGATNSEAAIFQRLSNVAARIEPIFDLYQPPADEAAKEDDK